MDSHSQSSTEKSLMMSLCRGVSSARETHTGWGGVSVEPYTPRVRGQGEGMLLPEPGEKAGVMEEGLQDDVPLEGSAPGTRREWE